VDSEENRGAVEGESFEEKGAAAPRRETPPSRSRARMGAMLMRSVHHRAVASLQASRSARGTKAPTRQHRSVAPSCRRRPVRSPRLESDGAHAFPPGRLLGKENGGVQEDGEVDASFVATSSKEMRSWFFILSSEEMKKLMLLSSLQCSRGWRS
jgi:hypothetical protein